MDQTANLVEIWTSSGLLEQSLKKVLTSNGVWKEYSNFWLFLADQKSGEWLLIRKGHVSGSICAACCGLSIYSTPYQEADLASGKSNKIFSKFEQDRMDRGTAREPRARKWLENRDKETIIELPFAVWKKNPYLGVSVDGLTQDRVIEIKSPDRMYQDLIKYTQGIKKDPSQTEWGKLLLLLNSEQISQLSELAHINPSHLCQMYLGMTVMNKRKATYVVFAEPENLVFTQDLYYLDWLWDLIIYPRIEYYIEQILKPRLIDTPYPIMPYPIDKTSRSLVCPYGFPQENREVSQYDGIMDAVFNL